MAKRQKLDYNRNELAQNLKESTGRGVDALFSHPSPTPSLPSKSNRQDSGPTNKQERPIKDSPKQSKRNTGQQARATTTVDQSTRLIQSTNPVDQPARPAQSTSRLGQLTGEIVKKPKSFYIPKAINDQIEVAVEYYQKKYNKDIDRSAVVSAFLGDPNSWTKEALDKISDKVIDQLKNRLNERLSSRLTQSTNRAD